MVSKASVFYPDSFFTFPCCRSAPLAAATIILPPPFLYSFSSMASPTTTKVSFSESSAHFNNHGSSHHRGGHRHSRRDGRTHRGSHHGSTSTHGPWQPHSSRPNSFPEFRPNRIWSGPPSSPSPYSSGWSSWAGNTWA